MYMRSKFEMFALNVIRYMVDWKLLSVEGAAKIGSGGDSKKEPEDMKMGVCQYRESIKNNTVDNLPVLFTLAKGSDREERLVLGPVF
ncbi:MAG: hypothetical protein ACI8TV_000509 [Porticoccaceae bacterium]|jgi:hypothetical protein